MTISAGIPHQIGDYQVYAYFRNPGDRQVKMFGIQKSTSDGIERIVDSLTEDKALLLAAALANASI